MHFRNLACDRQTAPNYSDRSHLDMCWVFPNLFGVRVLVCSSVVGEVVSDIIYDVLEAGPKKVNFIFAENREQDHAGHGGLTASKTILSDLTACFITSQLDGVSVGISYLTRS